MFRNMNQVVHVQSEPEIIFVYTCSSHGVVDHLNQDNMSNSVIFGSLVAMCTSCLQK